MAIAMAMGVSGGWNYGDAMGMGWDSWYVEVHRLAAYLGRHDAIIDKYRHLVLWVERQLIHRML